MRHVLLLQLPVPRRNYARHAGNIPFGAACLHQASAGVKDVQVDILSQALSTHAGDGALLDYMIDRRPDIIGFTCYLWNIRRTLFLCRQIKRTYNPRIVLGGPEITPDNDAIYDDAVDFYAHGEGEALFVELLQHSGLWHKRFGQGSVSNHFTRSPSPYFSTPLTPVPENTMLLETQRGCPYQCAFCFYNKAHNKLVFKEDQQVLHAVAWARQHNVREVYLLDPSLNSRPGLKHLLAQIAAVNSDHKLSFTSEIRAEAVDEELADLLFTAGFTSLEVGLQSTNPAALKAMHRHGDLAKFVRGAHLLMNRKITPSVDLIVGLPEDDLQGFARTVDFVADHDLHGSIQVFPLCLIPGTEFRKNHRALGLAYEPMPPYTVLSTPTFSKEDMRAAFSLAEEKFDISLYPLPDLNLAYQTHGKNHILSGEDIRVEVDREKLVAKVVLRVGRTDNDLVQTAGKVTNPYQLFIPPKTSFASAAHGISLFTRTNPHTPIEVVFFAPEFLPDVKQLLALAELERPHYLDNDLRFLYPEPGNRAILFTVVSGHTEVSFPGPNMRHIFWWRESGLPDRNRMLSLEARGYNGILVDPPEITDAHYRWQDDMALVCEDLPLISFALSALQKCWMEKTNPLDYGFDLLP